MATVIQLARKSVYDLVVIEQGGRCALSGLKPDDMHEWLVKRSGLPILRLQPKIYSVFNCILLSRAQHGRTDSNMRDYLCAIYKVNRYGFDAIEEWLCGLGLRTFGTFEQWLNHKEHVLQVPFNLKNQLNLANEFFMSNSMIK